MIQRKIGFWAVLSIVIGSQIGSGMVVLPVVLAPYGYFSLIGWSISGIAAMCLAMTFAFLCSCFPKTGGPHAYVQRAFGSHAAFFIGWAYWLASWVSTVVVVIAAIGYLSPFIGDRSAAVYLILEIALVCFITILNLRGVHTAGRAEFFLALLKFVPLLILPLVALYFFKSSNFVVSQEVSSLSITKILGQVAMLTMWGFIGVETGTTPAGSVENPSKTIPRALVFGTFCVTLFYFLNSVGIMGLMPAEILAQSKAPYVDAAQYIFGGDWYFIVSIMVFLVCVGTLNAWTLTSGQVILGLAEDGLMPRFFVKKNKHHAPSWGILVSSLGIMVILVLTSNKSLAKQISAIIDYSVTVFLFVYLMCALAAIKISMQKHASLRLFQWLSICIAIAFCSWVIYQTPLQSLIVSSLFILSGLPIYIFWFFRKKI
jgi:APA family basic amino acid/polyamine antiporter